MQYKITITNKETGLEITRAYEDLFFEKADSEVGSQIIDMYEQLHPQKEIF